MNNANSRANLHCPTESVEQQCLFRWIAYQRALRPELDLLYHIPNGGKRGKAEAARFKTEGVKPGIPDLHLPVARHGHHSLYIEIKRRDGGRVSQAQRERITLLEAQGNRVEVCRGWEEAAEVLVDYLEG